MIGHATATDISPGMLATHARQRRAARASATQVETVVTDAEQLPFDDEAFDLVFGHAVLHHLPDLDRAFCGVPARAEARAGRCSSPASRRATATASPRTPSARAMKASPLWRRLMRAEPTRANGHGPAHHRHAIDGHALEAFVDVHAFDPPMLRDFATRAGFADVRVRGEELLANWFGWANRTLESTAEPETVPWLWRQYAFRGYIALQAVDRALLEPRLPPAIFYNLIVAATKPA